MQGTGIFQNSCVCFLSEREEKKNINLMSDAWGKGKLLPGSLTSISKSYQITSYLNPYIYRNLKMTICDLRVVILALVICTNTMKDQGLTI